MKRNNLVIISGIAVAALAANAFFAPKAAAIVSGVPNSNKTGNKALAATLVSDYDIRTFGGWFSQGGRSQKDVMAIFQIESGFNPAAINRNDPFGGAWGIGQILADVARIDYGVASPEQLLIRSIGVLTSMRHLQFIWGDLTRRLGRNPTKSEWIMAYNAGSRGVAEGRGSKTYLAKFTAARAVV